jgi:hypothetical protein
MRTSAALFIGALCIVALFAIVWLVPVLATSQTVTGQVVDLVCYARNKANTGLDHDDGRVCAMACVKWEGNPIGIVAADGTVYEFAGDLVANNNTKAAPLLAHTVTVTGDVTQKDGMTMLSANAGDVKVIK